MSDTAPDTIPAVAPQAEAVQYQLRRLAHQGEVAWLNQKVARRLGSKLEMIKLVPSDWVHWNAWLGGGEEVVRAHYPEARRWVQTLRTTEHADVVVIGIGIVPNIELASENGIVVGNGQTRENYESMAEAGVMLILMSLYDVHRTERVLRENLPRPHESELNARMLRGKTVGLVGFGKIGRTIARYAANNSNLSERGKNTQ